MPAEYASAVDLSAITADLTTIKANVGHLGGSALTPSSEVIGATVGPVGPVYETVPTPKLTGLTALKTGYVNISYEFMYAGGADVARAQVYVDGVAVGNYESTGSSSFVTINVLGVAVTEGDSIVLYVDRVGGPNGSYARNLKVEGTLV